MTTNADAGESTIIPVTPPGSVGKKQHKQRCVGCQACVLSCPVGIIRPHGVDHRPVLDYEYGYCQYNCVDCSVSCPAGVFQPINVEEKHSLRIALTELKLERCVVKTQGTACGACAEVCPTHAVSMAAQGENLPTLPDFDPDYCIGCGACYHVCPAEPRAFVITGLNKHETSHGVRPFGHESPELPLSTDGSAEDGDLTDFPF